MGNATKGPIELSVTFWRSGPVMRALADRDMSLLFQQANRRGLSQTQLGEAVGLSQGRISETMRGKRRITRLDVIERIASGLNMPADSRMLLGITPRTTQEATRRKDSPAVPLRRGQQEIDDMNRRELLRLLAVAGATLTMPPDTVPFDWERATSPLRSGAPDNGSLDEYASLNARLWQLYAETPTKSTVYPLVKNQLSVLTDSLREVQRTGARQRMAAFVADLFQLAGEISFDASRYTDAAHCYTLAATASKEANDYDLFACAMTRHAFIGVYESEFEKALPMLQLAGSLARSGDQKLSTRFWVSCVEAQAHAGLGDLSGFQKAMEHAEGVRGLSGVHHNGGWLRFDGSRIDEERGTSYVSLNRPELAEPALTSALGTALSARRRGCVLTDLAMTGVQRGDPEQIVAHGSAALEMAQRTRSGVIVSKLRAVQPHLRPFSKARDIRHLSSEIGALTTI